MVTGIKKASRQPVEAQREIEQVLQLVDREIWLLTSQTMASRGGLIVTFVAQASTVTELPRVLVGLAKYHHTAGLVAESRRFALHLLAADQLDWVWHFGLQSGQDRDKLAGFSLPEGEDIPRLDGVVAWLDCRVEASFDIGDRMLYVAEITRGEVNRRRQCLTTKRLAKLASRRRWKQLSDQQARDAAPDAAAIAAWRKARRTSD